MAKAPTLYDAAEGLLGPLSAEYGRIIDEGDGEMPVEISLGGYKHTTTLQVIKDLDRAHSAAFEAKCARSSRKARGSLL
jgi:hypothetical protein